VKITHYLYNSFLIEDGNEKIAIDPGGLFLYYFRLTTLIPKSEWKDVTHIFVTHGDPDHYWHADRLAEASGAPLICNETMVRTIEGEALALGPRSKGLAFTTPIKNLRTLSVDETIEVGELTVTGLKATHGELVLKVGPFSKTVKPGPKERIGWGAIGFHIELNGKSIANLGDTLFQATEWKRIDSPDVLMIPIGGRTAHNTMDEMEAAKTVEIIRPRIVIPCHYNCPGLFTRSYNPADDQRFKKEAESSGARCIILGEGESVNI